MSQTVSNHVKIGSSDINSISVGNFSVGVKGAADYGPTSDTGFYNGVTIPVGGYAIYVEKSSQGPSIHAPRTDEECLYYLNKYGANATNITDALTWASTQSNLLVRSSEYPLSDLIFTISSSDFAVTTTGYGCEGDNTGFNIAGSYNSGQAFYQANFALSVSGNIAKADQITDYFNANGLTVNNYSYLFNVTYGPGSTVSSGIAVLSFYYYNDQTVWLNIGTVDTSVPGWDTPNTDPYNNLTALNGTFNTPMSFSVYNPITQDPSDWC